MEDQNADILGHKARNIGKNNKMINTHKINVILI